MDAVNRQVRLASRPDGMAKRSDFSFTEEPVRDPGPGEVLVRIQDVSLDPAMRGWMSDRRSYVPPVALGDVMRAGAAGTVEASNDPAFAPGDAVTGVLGVQEWATVAGRELTRVDTGLAPLPVHLGTLGMPGLTAYFGLLDVGAAVEGNTVVVSGAAGAGGSDKCAYVVDELGFDAAIDYKEENVGARMREECPSGIDVYFDNVGGEILDAALARLARGARVVICGAISQYNATGPMTGPSNYMSLLVNRASMRGFLVFDFADRYAEGVADLARWLREGR